MADHRRNEVAARMWVRRQLGEQAEIQLLETGIAEINHPAAIVRDHRHVEVIGNVAVLQVPVVSNSLRWVVAQGELEAKRRLLVAAVREPREQSRFAGSRNAIGRRFRRVWLGLLLLLPGVNEDLADRMTEHRDGSFFRDPTAAPPTPPRPP